MTDNNEYCEKHCKGYRDTGRCFADGRCDEYWEYQKQKGTMTKWNDKKNTTLTFKVEPNEEAKAFFERMQKELTEREEAFKKRIKQLFDEEIRVGGDKADEAYKQILQVFTIGYQHGWNDLYSLHKAKGD